MKDLEIREFPNPTVAVEAAIDIYGPAAATAAAWCALEAHFDGREHSFQFWFSVFMELKHGNDAWNSSQ